MTFTQFLGQVKVGKGMAALSREADRIGIPKVENMERVGVAIGKALGVRGMDTAERGLETYDKVKDNAVGIGNTLEAAQRTGQSGDLVGVATQVRSAMDQSRAAGRSARAAGRRMQSGQG